MTHRNATRLSSTMQEVPLSLGTVIRHGTATYPDAKVSVYDGVGTEHTTFAELGRRAARLAHGLRSVLEARTAEPVATLMHNTAEHLEAYLAVPGMGAVLHTLNVRYSIDQLAHTVRQTGDRIVIVEQSVVGRLVEVLSSAPSIEEVVVVGGERVDPAVREQLARPGLTVRAYAELLDGQPDQYDWPELPETAPALMCYTTGTTGEPKGVVYSHRSVYLASMQMCMGDYLGLSEEDIGLVVVPLFHVNGWNFPFAAMMVGMALVLPGRFLQPAHLARLIEQERPTVSAGVPTVWSDLLAFARAAGTDLSSLRDVVVGGSVCTRGLIEAYEHDHGVRLRHGWGMTEMSPFGALAGRWAGDDEATWDLRVSQGRLLGSVQARVVGPDGAVLPNDGEHMGEIEVRGPWVTGGYLGLPSPGREADRWLPTGDIATISPNRVVRLKDRSKDVIKSGGEWIVSLDLERHLGRHPDVADVAVIGIPDERWGERPLAVVTSPKVLDFAELAVFLAGRIDRWQVPERWAQVAALPRTTVGKPDKQAIRELYADGSLTVSEVPASRSDADSATVVRP